MTKNITHIFFCINQKMKGKCCAQFNAELTADYFKEALKRTATFSDPNRRFKVVKTSCLGQCAVGPNIFISPDNIWYNFSCTADIDEIIDSHLIKGQIVERLVNPGICNNDVNKK